MNKFLIISVISIFGFISCNSNKKQPNSNPTSIDLSTQWVDSLYNNMSLKEKVGQLFMVAAYSNRDSIHTGFIKNLTQDYHIGGLIFFQGDPVNQANQTNKYQAISKVPLFIGIDGEWGLNMRLDSTSKYPYNMTLGAIKQNHVIKRIGKQIGKDCKRLGIHINFAPVVDINTNPKNPIIGVRSFGEDKINVTKKAIAFTEGLQSEGVLACAKHFPGHGDTDTDSHKTLPTVSFTKERIDSVELYPYKQLFSKGITGVMVAHLNVPGLEQENGLPSSLSHQIVTNVLKEKLAFKGLIFTDALNMKGAANYKEPGDIDLAAFKAGNDVLLFTEDAPKAISKIMEAYNTNEITEERLSHSVKKILTAKFNAGLNHFKPIEVNNLLNDLNKGINDTLYEEVINNAITLIKNDDAVLPLQKKSNEKIALLKLGDGRTEAFLNAIKLKTSVTDVSNLSQKNLSNELKKYDKIIVGYHRLNSRITKAISNKDRMLIENLSKNHKVILTVFASQYSLQNLSLENVEGVIVSYENSEWANNISAQIIFGEAEAKGRLPASISKIFPTHYSVSMIQND
ncbi:glycoside hydrolase family 3 protein [Wocania ichthyoenteri]|uniref:glycoside hydrolase family 3 protein n=1 Tax=Wocania ichthyoenteri TaxID=1230531 RepID=UPI0009DC947E|nr:glycoside hydrolase family 3 protein [Wocania ichthyoenteri]